MLDRWNALRTERDSSWTAHWQDLSDNIQPRRSRFLSTQSDGTGSSSSGTGVNRSKRNDKIYNSTPVFAVDTSAAGMMGGITSPAREWIRVTTADPVIEEDADARDWLHGVQSLLLEVFARSNLYGALHAIYLDLLCFGTSCVHIEEDGEDLVRAYHFPVGQYALANSSRNRVDTVYRELSMTVRQLVEKFGLENCSLTVRNAYKDKNYLSPVQVLHAVEPNFDHEPGRVGSFPYKSCWLELASNDQQVEFLAVSGYEEFPCVVPRWDVTGEDVYGTSPGMAALGDCKALQHLEKRYAVIVDKITNPPLKGPTSLLHKRVSQLPGDFTPVDIAQGGQTLEPMMLVPPQALPAIETKIAKKEAAILRAFRADMWRAFNDAERPQMTAYEAEQRKQEVMLQLGPVMERLQDELLDPLIDRVFAILVRNGWVQPPPQSVAEAGADLKVEYVSILTQAQKAVGIVSLERYAAQVMNWAQARPDVLDTVDWDKLVQRHGEAVGVPPDVMMAPNEVEAIRQARTEQRNQEAQQAQELANAQTAQTLSQTDTGGDNALTRILQGVQSPDAQVGLA